MCEKCRQGNGAYEEMSIRHNVPHLDDLITDATIGDESLEVVDFIFVGLRPDGSLFSQSSATSKRSYDIVIKQAQDVAKKLFNTLQSEGK